MIRCQFFIFGCGNNMHVEFLLKLVENYFSLGYIFILFFIACVWRGLLAFEICTSENKFRCYMSKIESLEVLGLIQPVVMLLSYSLKNNGKQVRFWTIIIIVYLLSIALINIFIANWEANELVNSGYGDVENRLIKNKTKSYYVEELITYTHSGFLGLGKNTTNINRVIKGKKE